EPEYRSLCGHSPFLPERGPDASMVEASPGNAESPRLGLPLRELPLPAASVRGPRGGRSDSRRPGVVACRALLFRRDPVRLLAQHSRPSIPWLADARALDRAALPAGLRLVSRLLRTFRPVELRTNGAGAKGHEKPVWHRAAGQCTDRFRSDLAGPARFLARGPGLQRVLCAQPAGVPSRQRRKARPQTDWLLPGSRRAIAVDEPQGATACRTR